MGFLGSEGSSSTGGEPNANSAPAPSLDGDISYPEGFDDSLKGHQSILKFYDKEKKSFNISNLAKSYVNAESLLGKDKIPVPHKEFTEDNWNSLYDKLGRPSRDKYEVKNNLAPNLEGDSEFFNKYLDNAHKAGLLPKQAQEIADFFNAESSAIMQREEEGKKAVLAEGIKSLQTEWGNNYKSNLDKATDALMTFSSAEEVKAMGEAGILDNPILTKLFHKIADSLKEDKFKTETKGTFGMGREEITNKIQEFYRQDHPFMQRNHPQKDYYQDQMLKMQQMLTKMN